MGHHADRRGRVVEALPADVDALVVSSPVNVRYLTGFTGSNGAVLLRRDPAAILATDGRYVLQGEQQAPDLQLVETRSPVAELASRAGGLGLRRLGIEARHVTVADMSMLSQLDLGIEIVAVDSAVEDVRIVKDDDELSAITAACAITDRAFADIVERIRPGQTERAVSWLLRASMHEHGAEDLAFASIVAFGPNSAVPHHEPTDRPLSAGDLVKLDFGARVDGYHADLTRTLVVRPVADWQRDLHAFVVELQSRLRRLTSVGAAPSRLNEQYATQLDEAGHVVRHGLGHGVGLEIHESPMLTAASTAARLQPNVPVTIEPGVYLPGRGGVRIEDTVVVCTDGAEPLTGSPRDLIEID